MGDTDGVLRRAGEESKVHACTTDMSCRCDVETSCENHLIRTCRAVPVTSSVASKMTTETGMPVTSPPQTWIMPAVDEQFAYDVARLVGRKEHNGLCDFVLLPAAKSRPGTFGSVLLSQNVRKFRSNAQPIRPMRQIAAIHLSPHPRHDAFGIDEILRAAHFQFLKQQVLGGRKPQISFVESLLPATRKGSSVVFIAAKHNVDGSPPRTKAAMKMADHRIVSIPHLIEMKTKLFEPVRKRLRQRGCLDHEVDVESSARPAPRG